MKRLISVLLSSALLCALLLPAAAAADAPSAWANDEVYRALELGFVPEKLQGDYQKEITRAEFAEIAIYFLAVQYGYPANAKGGDGTGSNYQVENFLTDYCDKKNDRTGRPFDLKSYDPDGVNTTFHWWTAFTSQEKFSDVDMSDTETRGFVNAAYALGIVNGTNESATSFHPNGAITRQEAAVMVALAQILSYLKLMELPNGGSLPPAMFPIILFAVRWGTAPGLMAGFVFGLLQLIFDGAYAWGWQSMLLDYLLACVILFSICFSVVLFFVRRKHYTLEPGPLPFSRAEKAHACFTSPWVWILLVGGLAYSGVSIFL